MPKQRLTVHVYVFPKVLVNIHVKVLSIMLVYVLDDRRKVPNQRLAVLVFVFL